eukprot:4354220-Amphidinium_carterae.1
MVAEQMVAELRIRTIAERDETVIEDNILNEENEDELNNPVRLHVHMTDQTTYADTVRRWEPTIQ